MVERTRALSDVLDELEDAIQGEEIAVQEIVDRLGERSFASLMLVFSLIAVSPASAIPGITATVAVIVFILTVQMIFGRRSVWLPGLITRRRVSSGMLCKGISWLRKPLHVIERYIGKRLTFLVHRPWLFLPLGCILVLTLAMPFMELIPTSGSIASAAIALFAAGLLTRDGVLVLVSLIPLSAVPVLIWQVGFGA
ncbi:exopolysaccharide biosynthesis protein [Cereibacter sphaeroides]|uniref:Exopolysaccharide biosynthesis protein n=1 Tax=Cereibacter sphaeroides TaxID=1063 RepID=A0AAX1UKJ5_CERSP|nr:exopolysaccharide biosynthesis protein [Cereibacter sphaeroides]RHZ94272.1 exopolysaccharide biosynthesis protein [Cereibacter sphaeroides]